jgi:predicted DNA-binding ribbon-helix-helix protein
MRKHSLVIAGHATSVSLEQEFWDVLKEIADKRGIALAALIAEVDEARRENLSSALRLHVLRELREKT